MALVASKSALVPPCSYEIGKDTEECLYTAFRMANGTSKSSTNETIQRLVADYLFTRDILESKRLQIPQKYKSVKDCYQQIKEDKLCAGDNQWQALARISKLVIVIISNKIIGDDHENAQVSKYGEDDPSVKECVYLLYNKDTKRYTPLYVHDKTSNQRFTVCPRDDPNISQVFDAFIRDKPDGHAYHAPESEVVQETSASDQGDDIERLVSMAPTVIRTDIPYRKVVDFKSSTPTERAIEKSIKRAKVDEEDTTPSNKKNRYIETPEQSSSKEPSVVPKSIPAPRSNDERMRLEVEPALRFRGRTPGDFKPNKRLPRYFADRNGKTFLHLLISEKFLSCDSEYRVQIHLITREIDGCSYVQPYFKFQGDASDKEKLDENPKYVTFTINDLQDHSEGVKKLLLQLVVIQRTNPQLMKAQQPLEVFSSEIDATPITTSYTDKHLFKEAFHLHDVRFAVTLFKKQPGETNFCRCDDIQYISQISTEDKTYKIREQTNEDDHH